MLNTSATALLADRNDLDTVDAKLTELSQTQSALDVEIGEWLLAAERINLHVKFGYASIFEYADRKFGWEPRAVFERLRVARKLETLVATREELRAGNITWSVVREISRIAETPDVEAEWLEAVRGCTVREVERLVADHKKNARPNDKKDATVRRHAVYLSFTSEEYARFQESIERERAQTGDPSMTEEQAIISSLTHGGDGDTGTTANQLAFVRGVGSDETFVQTHRGPERVPPTTAERVACDATIIPATVDGKIVDKASQTIPPGIRRQVIVEARGCCEVPGCLKRYLEVHHRTFRSDGGTHELRFLIAICWFHHRRIHDGYLQLDGDRVSGWEFRHADGSEYGSPGTPKMQADVAEAYHGLRRLGYKDPDARAAASGAASELLHDGLPVNGESILKRALYRAGKPKTAAAPTVHVGTNATPKGATAAATAHVGTNASVAQLEAISGLRNLGYREPEARSAVASAVAGLGDKPMTVENLIVEALRVRGASLLSREASPTYGTAHVGSDPGSMTSECAATYGGIAHVGNDLAPMLRSITAHVGSELAPSAHVGNARLDDLLRRAMNGDRQVTVRLRLRVPA